MHLTISLHAMSSHILLIVPPPSDSDVSHSPDILTRRSLSNTSLHNVGLRLLCHIRCLLTLLRSRTHMALPPHLLQAQQLDNFRSAYQVLQDRVHQAVRIHVGDAQRLDYVRQQAFTLLRSA